MRSHLDLGGEEVSAGAAAQLVRECKTDRQAAAALAAAHDGVVRAGFSAADASRALACVAARRGARASLARHALDWLCLRLDHGPRLWWRQHRLRRQRGRQWRARGRLLQRLRTLLRRAPLRRRLLVRLRGERSPLRPPLPVEAGAGWAGLGVHAATRRRRLSGRAPLRSSLD